MARAVKQVQIKRFLKRFFLNKWLYTVPLAAYFLFISFPGNYLQLSTGLDNSWIYAINYLVNSDIQLGQDVFFMYGPLGYLLYPLNIGNNLIFSFIFRLGLYFLLAFLIIYHAIKSNNTISYIIFLITISVTYVLFFASAYQYCILFICGLALCTYFTAQNSSTRYILLPFAGLIAASSPFMKLDFGIAAISMIIMGLLWQFWKCQKRIHSYLILCLLPCAIWIFIQTIIFTGSLDSLISWMTISLELIGGYGSTMSVIGPTSILILGTTVLLFFIILILDNNNWQTGLLVPAVIFCIPVALSFKHGFCRQDPHCVLFFLFSMAVLSIFILFSLKKRQLWFSSIAFISVMVIALPVMLIYSDYSFTKDTINRLSGVHGLKPVISLINAGSSYTPTENRDQLKSDSDKMSLSSDLAVLSDVMASIKETAFIKSVSNSVSGVYAYNRIVSLINLAETQHKLDDAGKFNLEKDKLPVEWCDLINGAQGSVDVIHWEITYCPANGFKWAPNPVLQTNIAYTSYLDKLCADHFSSEDSPNFIIFEYADIDGRHPLTSTPACWQKIMENYQVVKQDINKGIFLLQKRDEPCKGIIDHILLKESIRFGDWINVPPSTELVLADFDIQLTLPGKLIGSLLRVPPIYMDLTYDTGEKGSYRMVPGNAVNGVIINLLPSDAHDFSDLCSGQLNKKVVRIRLSGPGIIYYADQIHITWKERPNLFQTPAEFGLEKFENQVKECNGM